MDISSGYTVHRALQVGETRLGGDLPSGLAFGFGWRWLELVMLPRSVKMRDPFDVRVSDRVLDRSLLSTCLVAVCSSCKTGCHEMVDQIQSNPLMGMARLPTCQVGRISSSDAGDVSPP